ncbi:MAG: SDR family NAD(P)-dependent oxidoreductase, partial [Gammaproteobacteria bacterium]
MITEYIIITGAGSGIGKAAALACNMRGYHVIAIGRDKNKLLQLHTEAKNPKHMQCLALDIKEYSSLCQIEAAIPLNGKLACLFHSAAVVEPWGRSNVESEEVFYHHKINVSAVKLLTMKLMSKMDSESRVLIIGSYFGDRSPEEVEKLRNVCEAYLDSKTRVIRETLELQRELLPDSPTIVLAKPGRVAGTGIYDAFWRGNHDPNPTITPAESAEFLL